MTEPLETWPAAVTQNMVRGTYSETPIDTLIAFPPDRGAPLTRQGTYIPLTKIQFQSPLTYAEKTALDTFYKTTCLQGTSRVTRKDPKSGTSRTMKFDGPPAYSDAGPQGYFVALRFWVFA